MLTKPTPGEQRDFVGNRNFEGSTIMLSVDLEDQKGEQEKEVFRIVKFQKINPKGISLVDVVLNVELYNKKYGTFFKATFDDPSKVVADHKVPMDIIIYILEEIFSSRADNVIMSYENNNGKEDLLIMTNIDSKVYNRTVTFKFCYKFQIAKMSFEERINMELAIIEQKVDEQQIEKGKSRLEEIEDRLKLLKDMNHNTWFIPGKRVMEAQFDIDRNNNYTLADNGTTVTLTGTTNVFNTITLTTLMENTVAYRARFRVASMISNHDYLMIGVVSNSFSLWKTTPASTKFAWLAYFHSSKLQSSYQHNGNFQTTNGAAPFAGSIVTVEFYPKQGRIQYFVNSTPVARHLSCTFNDGICSFAVTTYEKGAKVNLLSVEQIQDVF